MQQTPRRLADRIADPEYLEQLGSVSTPDLRRMREECEELENEISYTRRLLQGKLDILRHELDRRSVGGDRSVSKLIERLPDILSDHPRRKGNRHLKTLVPRNAEDQRRGVDRLASDGLLSKIDEVEAEDLEALLNRLVEAEIKASDERRAIHEVTDSVRDELVRRYREGTADPTQLLSS